MAGPKTRVINGQAPGWLGHVRNYFPVTPSDGQTTADDVAFFDPPLRLVFATGAGNIVCVLDGDDEAVSGKKVTIPVAANERLSEFAIRKVFATGTTATGIAGFK